jgi:hypothetical protein
LLARYVQAGDIDSALNELRRFFQPQVALDSTLFKARRCALLAVRCR